MVAANTKLENGTKVQLFVNVGGPALKWEIQGGAIKERESVGSYLVTMDDGSTLLVHRTQLTVVPTVDYLPTEERKVVSARKLTIKAERLKACPSRECMAGFTCATHKEV